jgi:hypothetical protein
MMAGSGASFGGRGLAFIYGPVAYPPEPFDEQGTGRGLNVQLLTSET